MYLDTYIKYLYGSAYALKYKHSKQKKNYI